MRISCKQTIALLLTLVLLLTLCALLALVSCEKESEQPSGTLEATNDAVDFYFYYPDTWQVYLDTGMIAVKPTPSSSGIVGTSISVSAFELDGEDANWGVNDYWDNYKGTLEKTFHDYALEGESELTLDGVPAVRKEYKGALTETTYRFAQVFCIRNGTIYQITFTANDADYDRYISALDTIVTNFHFK